MDGNFWLLLLIIVIVGLVGGAILFFMRYAKVKENVNRMLNDSREQLLRQREKIRALNREYLALFPGQDATESGSPAPEFEANFRKAQESNLRGLREQQRISRSLPRKEKASLKYWLGEFDRMQIWRRADREAGQLQLEIQENENQIGKVEEALRALKDLPVKISTLARDTRELLRETKSMLESLAADYGMSGKTMEDSLQSIAEMEEGLENIPHHFFDLSPDELSAISNVRSDAEQAQPILGQTRERLLKLNAKAKVWKAKIEELRKRSVDLQERAEQTGLSLDQLDEHLVLAEEQAQLASLRQRVDQVKARIAAPTIEDLDPTGDEVRETLTALTALSQTLQEYGTLLQSFQELYAGDSEQQQAVGNTMKTVSARPEYPVQWQDSRTVFDDVQGRYASIRPLTERRTPEELKKDLETAGACADSLSKLHAKSERTAAELEELSGLWVKLKPTCTREWLAGVEQLFSELKVYDMDSNWASSDRVASISSDAGDLVRRAEKNIPLEASLTVQEEQVGPRLLEARDLAAKKTLFDERKARIETRLKQMQEEEKEAGDILRRVSPVVTLFAREIDRINVPTQAAKNMKSANVARLSLEKSLGQRDQGNVSTKHKDVCAWERSTAENGAMVCRWVEEDRLKKMVSISGNLREMESFAADLKDDVVVKAHKYDLEFAPAPIDTECLKTQSLDAIQDEAAKLFAEWHTVMELQGELQKFLAPLREEHDRMLAALKDLQENCTQLEKQLSRDWPVVFQSASILRERVENLTHAVNGSKSLRWICDDLQRNYYYLWQKLHDLDSETNTVRQRDQQDLVEMQTLEKELQNSARDYARRIFEGHEASIRQEIAAGDAYLKSLADQYRNGRKNGTNIPPAQEIKAQMQRKIDGYKQKLHDYNYQRQDDSLLERERKRQFMPAGNEISVPLSKGEFVTALLRLIMDLDKITSQHPDIADAIEDLRSAHREALKTRPDPAEIKRLLKNARGTLAAVEKTVPEVALVLEGINTLAGVIQNIFP